MVRNVSKYTVLALEQVLVLLIAPVAATGPTTGPQSPSNERSPTVPTPPILSP
ncbi:hypothetical protein [Haladaptatus sp. W1]|uniref:hypothetical protein n=1 Tax=Haladaptatus sp. W1 TaxID=1897478 RepID=UPI0020C75B32|nr:hypothetical protein [Haladaptatus sp. W1]